MPLEPWTQQEIAAYQEDRAALDVVREEVEKLEAMLPADREQARCRAVYRLAVSRHSDMHYTLAPRYHRASVVCRVLWEYVRRALALVD